MEFDVLDDTILARFFQLFICTTLLLKILSVGWLEHVVMGGQVTRARMKLKGPHARVWDQSEST